MRRLLFLAGLTALLSLVPASSILAQAPMSDATLARETSDPTTDLWLLFAEFATSFTPSRPYASSNQFTLELQPSLPIPLTSSLRLLNFPEFIFASEGTRSHRQATGLQTFSYFSALSPATAPTGFAWGVGPYASFPVSTDQDLAASQWQLGGGAVVSWRNQSFLTSLLVKSGWTVAGIGDEAGSLQVQYNFQHFFGDGYQVGLGRPTIEYTWRRDGTGAWTIPVGVDIAKIFHFGRLPVKIMLEYDLAVLNENRWAPEHTVRLTITPVIPSLIREPIFE